MGILVKDKSILKKKIKEILSELITKPNKDILSITASYDPNLNTVTLRYTSLGKEESINFMVFDEKCEEGS